MVKPVILNEYYTNKVKERNNMAIEDFKAYMKTRQPLDTGDLHCFMDEMSDETRCITFQLNTAFERQFTYPALIILGKNVWIGSNATVLQGVTIGDNAVVATGVVVTKDVTANTVVDGVPVKFI